MVKVLAALAAVCVTAFGACAAVALPAPIPTDVLFRQDLITTMALSPDGAHVAALVQGRGDDADRIVVIDLGTFKTKRSITAGEYSARSISWASPTRILASFGVPRTVRGETYTVGSRLVTLDIDTGDMAVMFEGQKSALRRNRWLGRVASTLPNDPDHVLMPAATSSGQHLWRVNIETGAAEIAERGRDRTVYWFMDGAGRAVMRIDANSTYRTLYVYVRDEADPDDWKRLRKIRVRDDDQDSRDFWPVAPAPGDSRYYVLAHPEDEEFATIKLYDYEADELLETVIDAGDADVLRAITSAKTGELLGAQVMRDRIETILLDKTAQAHIRGLDAYFENDANVRFWGGSDKGRYALLFVSSPTRPGEFWVYDYEERAVTYLMDDKDGIDAASLGRMEVMAYASRDGTPLTAYVTHPAGAGPDDPAPLVALVHGGPEARDAYDFGRWVQYLASRGYRVVQPYFRGSEGKGRAFAAAGYGQWGGLMQDDVSDAVMALQADGLAEPETTCIVGASYGGYAALYGGATTPHLYACAASLNGVTDLVSQLRFDRREHGKDSEVYEYLLRGIGDPKRDKARLDAASPLAYAQSYPVPVHIGYAEDDRRVPQSQSKAMVKALRKADRPVTVIAFEDEGHSMSWSADRRYWRSLGAFLAEHIGGEE